MVLILAVLLFSFSGHCDSNENLDLEKRFANLEKIVRVQSEHIRKLELYLEIRDEKFKKQPEEVAKLKQCLNTNDESEGMLVLLINQLICHFLL